MDTCSQGECGITESACSDSSAGSVYDTCTSYNQDAVDNGDSDACTGTVSTRWTYDGYSYSQGPTSSPDPGSGGGTSDEYGDCECYCDGSYQGTSTSMMAKAALVSRRASAMITGHLRARRGFHVRQPLHGELGVQLHVHGGQLWWPSPGDSGPPPGGSTSTSTETASVCAARQLFQSSSLPEPSRP